MKQHFSLLIMASLILIAPEKVKSQQGVAINTNGAAPHQSAMLDVSSTNKGFLLPRMTSVQRSAINSPENGLLVYDTDRNQIYQREGNVWRSLLNSSFWSRSTTRDFIYNTTDSIGIGTTSPDEKFEIVNGNIKMQLSNISDIYNLIKFNSLIPTSGSWVKYQGMEFFVNSQPRGSLRFISGDNTGHKFQFSVRGGNTGDLVIDDEGHVGIGTQFPSNPLNINALNISGTTVHINDDDDPMIQMSQLGNAKAFMQVSGDDFRIGTNAGNNLGRVILRNGSANRLIVGSDGMVGIGVENMLAQLHINSGTSNSTLRIQGNSSPAIQFYSGTTSVGSLQASATYLSLLAPGKLLRLNNNLFVSDETNRVGVGTATPEQKLHVVGSAKITGGKVLNTSDDNMLPIGFATFDANGNKLSGSANVTAGWVGTDGIIICEGVNLSNATIMITPRNAKVSSSVFPGPGNNASIRFYNNSGDEVRVGFHAVIFKAD